MLLHRVIFVLLLVIPTVAIGQDASVMDDELLAIYQNLDEEKQVRLLKYAQQLEQEGEKLRTTTPKSKASANWHVGKYDFQTVKQGDVVFMPFTFTASGNTPYTIKKIKTSCDCISVDFPNKTYDDDLKGHVYDTDENGRINVILSTHELQGPTKLTVIIYDNSFPSGKKYLTITGNVQNKDVLTRY